MNGSNTTLTGNLAQMTGTAFTFVSPSGLAGTSLAPYDMVWLDGFSQYLDLSSLTPYLNGGGRVLVQNPGFGSEPFSAYPDGAGMSATFTYPPGEPNVHILVPGDFFNLGLTDAGLSGWGPSAYGHFVTTTATFLALSDNGTSGEYITVRRNGGPGVLVYTEQGISQFLSNNDVAPGAPQLQFLENVLLAAPEPGTAALLIAAFGLLALRRKRLRPRP